MSTEEETKMVPYGSPAEIQRRSRLSLPAHRWYEQMDTAFRNRLSPERELAAAQGTL